MTQDEKLDFLIEYLLAETGERYPDHVDSKSLLRGLMNRRMPRPVSDIFLDVQDAYFQEALKQNGCVDWKILPTIKAQFGCETDLSDKISLWKGDITTLKVDAIVNAANSQMLGCFIPNHRCIDNAIHSAAGLQLREACFEYMKSMRHKVPDYEEPTGKAVITDAFNLPCKHVIHTVGPIVYGDLSVESKSQLACSYQSILKIALQNDVRSLAFCCISTGEFHFPNKDAAEIAIREVKTYLKDFGKHFDRIVFNVFKEEDLKIYSRLLSESF